MPAYGSTDLTATATVKTGPGQLCAVLITAGADAASVTIYDNTTNSGDKLAVVKAAINTTAQFTPAQPIAAGIGLHAVITGTTPDVIIVWM